MIYADSMLRYLMEAGSLTIYPGPSDEAIQPTSIDLKLGHVKDADFTRYHELWGWWIQPGQFLLGSTFEWVCIPDDAVGILEGKSSLARMGILPHQCAGYIDPGFKGEITLELTNVRDEPFFLRQDMYIAQLCVSPVFGRVLRPYGSSGLGSHYQGQSGPTPSYMDEH